MNTTIIAVRHGETEWNKVGLQQGHLDSSLTDLGLKQAKELAKALKNYSSEQSFGAVYSSDLGRAKQTADVICHG